MAEADDRVQGLYALPPEEFTKARDQLARELRDAGDPAAAHVRGLRRPTLSLWVINQIARRHAAEVKELMAAGEELRAAQRAVMEGGSREAFQEAGAKRRKLLDRLLDRGQEIIREAGRPAERGRLDAVERTLMAATMSAEAGTEVASGSLTRELEPPEGFEALGFGQLPEAAPRARPSRRAKELDAQAEAAEEEARQAEDEAARVASEAQSAERAARDARGAADRAAGRAEKARRKADDLRHRADQTEAE